MAGRIGEWVEPDQAAIPGTVEPSEYLQRLAADGVLDEIDRLHEAAEAGRDVSNEPMTAKEFFDEARRRDADR